MSEQTNFAPYAPAKAVLGVIERYRERGLPDPLTTGNLEQVGVPASMGPRTLQALRFLGLIDEGGNRLESFEQLKRAKTDEYPAQLAEIVRAAYLPVFTVVDPATDTDTAVADAFRGYEPGAQREKMLALFRGLVSAAGIVERQHQARGGAPKKPTGGALAPRPKPGKKPTAQQAEPVSQDRSSDDEAMLDIRLITAIIQQLPRDRRWSTSRRQRWLGAITSAVDLLIETDDSAGVAQAEKPKAPKAE
jgi:hypothetical protein